MKNLLSYIKKGNKKDSEAWIHQDFEQMPEKGFPDDEIDHMDNGFEFSQSEIIDFSQGTDSD